MGDILLSGPAKPDISIPAWHLPNQVDFGGKRAAVAGLCQKVEIISDQLCVAWAGRAIEAHALIRHLRQYCGGDTITWEFFQQVIGNFGIENLRQTQFVAYLWTGAGFGSVDNTGSFALGDLEDIHLFGSGKEPLFATLDSISSHISNNRIRGTPELRGLLLALTFTGYAMCRQVFDGLGLVEGWGGGFEIVFFESSGKFMKLDRNLHVFLECVERPDGSVEVVLLKPFIYQFYRGPDLISLVNAGDTAVSNRLYLVSSFLSSPAAFDLSNLPKEYDAASVVASIRSTKRDGATNFGVQIWAGQYANSPVRIHNIEGGTRVGVKDQFVHDVVAIFHNSPSQVELTILQ